MQERRITVNFIESNKINLNAIAIVVANQIKNKELKEDDDRRTKVS